MVEVQAGEPDLIFPIVYGHAQFTRNICKLYICANETTDRTVHAKDYFSTLIVEDVLYHAAINISLGRMDGPEVIQATPHGHVLPKIQIERILLGNFDRLCRGVRTCVANVNRPL